MGPRFESWRAHPQSNERMKRAATILAVLALAACGSNGEREEAGTPSAVPEPPTAATVTDPLPADPAQGRVPAAVEETRRAIMEAAESGDYDALAALIPGSGFTFSYGAGESAIDYWKDLDAQGERPLETMAAVLALPHTRSRGTFVWPWAYDGDPADLTDEEKDALAGARVATRKQLDQMAEFGHYLGWRLGIRRDGTWLYFVAGD